MTETIQEPEIEAKQNLAREAASMIPIGRTGVDLQNFAQQVDYAKWMAAAGAYLPKHLRNNVGACLAVIDLSQRWGFSPFLVARMCYLVNDMIGFESQLVHAVIEKFAPLRQRLRCDFEGEGEDRVCRVTGHIKGESEPLIYRSPKFSKITPKNSPLWKTDSDQQFWYFSSRAWARRYCPDILMGIYGRDELQDNPHIGADNAKDVTDAANNLHERLVASKGNGSAEGFRAGVVEEVLGETAPPKAPETTAEAQGEAVTDAAVPPAARRKRRTKAEMEAARNAPPAEPTPPAPEPPPWEGAPETPEAYAEYCRAWVAQGDDYKAAIKRWTEENTLRDHLAIPVDMRVALRMSIDTKFERPT